MMAQKARPSFQEEDMLVIFTFGYPSVTLLAHTSNAFAPFTAITIYIFVNTIYVLNYISLFTYVQRITQFRILFINKFTFQLVHQFLSHFLSLSSGLCTPWTRFCLPDAVRPECPMLTSLFSVPSGCVRS